MSFRTNSVIICLTLSAIGGSATAGATDLRERQTRYRIHPDDVIEVSYRYTPEYDQKVTVQPDGYISLTLIGELHVGGMSLDEVKAALLTKASTRLIDPEVSVVLEEFVKPHFTVAGQVRSPGRYELHGATSAIEAIAMAGGFTNESKHSEVLLLRRRGPDLVQTELINIKRMMTQEGSDETLMIEPDDILVVPQNRISKIERFVRWTNVGMYVNPAVP